MVKLIDVTSHVKTRGRPTVKQMPELLDAGIDVIVNLLPGIDEMMVKWPKLYVHVPMPDGKFVHEGQVNFAVQGLGRGSPPSAARGASHYGPPTTAASLMGAAAFAYAAKIFGSRSEKELAAFGQDLGLRARQAWQWAASNPDVTYYNNDDVRQPGSKGLAAGQQEMDEEGRRQARFEAALHLFNLTGQAEYRAYLDANFEQVEPTYGPTQWSLDAYESLLVYSDLSHIAPAVRQRIREKFRSGILGAPY